MILQDVEIVVHPIPRIVSNWLIGIGKLLSTLIALKVPNYSPTAPPCGTLLLDANVCSLVSGYMLHKV